MRCNMVKLLESPTAIDKTLISSQGTPVTIIEARIAENIQTSMGVVHKALALTVSIDGVEGQYGHLFSMDKDPIAGSAARVIATTGIKDTDQLNPKTLASLKGKTFTVRNRGGKLYWG